MNAKKLCRCISKWILPSLFAVTLPIGTQTVIAQGENLDEAVTYESKDNGKWVGINPTAYENSALIPGFENVPYDYKGHRWDVTAGTSRDTFELDSSSPWGFTGDYFELPGMDAQFFILDNVSVSSKDGSNDADDTAIIRHHIVFDTFVEPQSPMYLFPINAAIGTLDIQAVGRLDLVETQLLTGKI